MAVRDFTFERSIAAQNPLRPGELQSAESILARLVAEAFAADHPELFAEKRSEESIIATSRLGRHPISSSEDDQGNVTAGDMYARME
jgi:hypothetical protein